MQTTKMVLREMKHVYKSLKKIRLLLTWC